MKEKAMCWCWRRDRWLASLLPLILLPQGLCAATEYYVKPTTPQETSCPREPCYTLDELATKYFYVDATDILMDNVTVILLSGTHELDDSIYIKEVNNLTLLGVNGEHPGEIKCKGVSSCSLAFIRILNLTITGITFSQCGKLEWQMGMFARGVLIFIDVFNLKMTWVVIQNSTEEAIYAVNMLGNSVIDHSTFETGHSIKDIQRAYYMGNCIYVSLENCNTTHYKCSKKTLSLLLAVNPHKLSIHNCVFTEIYNSVRIDLQHAGYSVELELTNITSVNGGSSSKRISEGDIHIDAKSEANYLVKIRDSYIGHSRGCAIFLRLQMLQTYYSEAHFSQTVHVINNTIDKSASGIHIKYRSLGTTMYPNIVIESCIITNISGDGRTDGYGLLIGELALGRFPVSVVLTNVTFENNHVLSKGGIRLSSARRVEMSDCRFVGNQGTSITAIDSIFRVSGTLSFVNNTAYQGGAMAFYGDSRMIFSLKQNTHILFINNYVNHVGGAIYIENMRNDINNNLNCFLRIVDIHYCSELYNKHRSLTFTNNTAQNGGDAIYGGSLHYCSAACCKIANLYIVDLTGASILIFNYWNAVSYEAPSSGSNLSLVSSEPTRVCLCKDGEPDCFTVFTNRTCYPGETFMVSAVVVGQGFGTTDGSVYARFQRLNTSPLATFNELQQSQLANHKICAKLIYTVLSANEKEVITLTTSSFGARGYSKRKTVDRYIRTYNSLKYLNRSFLILPDEMKELLSFPISINITLLPCPPGFMLSDQGVKCVCHTTIQQHNITCSIDSQTVHRGGTVWVNASFAGNKSNGVIVHHHCPYGYCNLEQLDIRLDFPDTQCNFNHSGILCGGCRQGLSLTLGTSQCLRCSNKYIALLLPFAIAGIVLVAFIKLLNLTVSEGTLNGLIFYANVLGANQATFFPSTSKHCPVLTVFIAWLNLDLGIESCFFNGLNGYWKTWLQFVFPAYIWIITAVMIIASHYSSTCARVFGNNSVHVLATLFLLSYAKLLRTFIVVISFTFLDHLDDSRTAVWLYDGTVQYLSPAHVPLFLVALTVFFILWLPYTLVLLLMQCIRKKTHHRALRFFARKKPLFDAYLGPFKDKHCYWVGVLLLMRALLLVIHAVNPNNAPKVNLFAIVVSTFALVTYTATVGKVYKKWYLTLLENSFLFNLGVLALGTLYTSGKGKSHTAVVHTLVGIAFLQFVGIIIFHGNCSIKNSRAWRDYRSSRRCTNRAENRNLDYQPFGEEQAQPVRLRMTFNELREPVLEYADDST